MWFTEHRFTALHITDILDNVAWFESGMVLNQARLAVVNQASETGVGDASVLEGSIHPLKHEHFVCLIHLAAQAVVPQQTENLFQILLQIITWACGIFDGEIFVQVMTTAWL